MIAGTIICDGKFRFSDGTTGKKLLLVLCSGSKGYCVIVKTTSKEKNKTLSYGCHLNDRFQNFFLPAKSCCLHENTWVMLNEFFEFSAGELLSRRFSGQIKIIGELPPKMLSEMLECAISSDDISSAQSFLLSNELQQLSF